MAPVGGAQEAHLNPVLDVGIPERKAKTQWPNLREGEFEETSLFDAFYNCIAWAMHDKQRWWEPSGLPEHYWPKNARRDWTVEAFHEAFGTRHFVPCDDGELEDGYEKLAIYWRPGTGAEDGFQHVARQLEDGRWTSKLGKAKDIAHPALDSLSGDFYGEVAYYMRRPRAKPKALPRRTRARRRRTHPGG